MRYNILLLIAYEAKEKMEKVQKSEIYAAKNIKFMFFQNKCTK